MRFFKRNKPEHEHDMHPMMKQQRRGHVTIGEFKGKCIEADCTMYECITCGLRQWGFDPKTAKVVGQ